MKKNMEEKLANALRELAKKVGNGDNANDEEYDMYKTLVDTFNAFDKDGNAELGYPEYKEAWKFLNQPGSEADIKRAFDLVDVDGSGLMDREEFLFSIMGEKAGNYGLLADLEAASGALDDILNNYSVIQEALAGAKGNAEETARKNAEVRTRLENMKGEVQGTMNELLSKMLGVNPEDVLSP
jgi:Ca2+-binding EF-hand superfamily protein